MDESNFHVEDGNGGFVDLPQSSNIYHDSTYHDNYSNYQSNDIAAHGGGGNVSEYDYYDDISHLTTNADGLIDNSTTVSGSFYPLAPQYVPHIQSAPISALAIDPNKDALYVAGHTVTLNRKRHHAMYSTPGMSSSGRSFTEQRVSMLATHSFPDGILYSACAGHDEAKGDLLNSISLSLFGCPLSSTDTTAPLFKQNAQQITRNNIPMHAYRPPYGSPSHPGLEAAAFPNSPFGTPNIPQMGITTILPFSCASHYYGDNTGRADGETYLCSVSPSSVRIHSHGGLLISENKTEGMLAGTFHPGGYDEGIDELTIGGVATHVTVAGVATNDSGHNIHCMDLYSSGLKTISSYAIRSDNPNVNDMCVADLVTNYDKGNVIAACSDGTLRLFDGAWRNGNFADCARVKAHSGGVTQVAANNNLICTTGFSSRRTPSSIHATSGTNPPYAYPDQHLLVFDIRMLGRGGIAHPFSGLKGGPRFISFLKGASQESEQARILIASGQNAGGLQIITPFESLDDRQSENVADYLHLPLAEDECITAMSSMDKDLAIATSHGNILQYRMTDAPKNRGPSATNSAYEAGQMPSSEPKNDCRTDSEGEGWTGTSLIAVKKEQIVSPSYVPGPPELSIEPVILLPNFVDQDSNCIYRHSIFNSYIFQLESTLSYLCEKTDKRGYQAFGPLSRSVLLQSEKRVLSDKLNEMISNQEATSFLASIPSSDLKLDLLANNGRKNALLNPNKLLYGKRLSGICYDINADPRNENHRRRRPNDAGGHLQKGHENSVPIRYKCKYRPPYSMFSAFDFASLNSTIYPGWDYAPSMPNAYASPVLLLLYFVPEIRNAMLSSQLSSNISRCMSTSNSMEKKNRSQVSTDGALLSAELGFLFHQIESIGANAMSYPKAPGDNKDCSTPVVGAFVPSNFLSALSILPEASALALLDGEAAAVEVARRPEAFYRFLVYHLDRELNFIADNGDLPGVERPSQNKSTNDEDNVREEDSHSKLNLIDSLQCMNSVSLNEFITGSGPPSVSSTRSYTVDLAYDAFLSKSGDVSALPHFGDVLRYSLCKDVRLRAWCQATKSYETVVQRKIITSLPKILSLSCACAGNNGEDRLPLWRNTQQGDDHWLPEIVEVEIEKNGNIITRQLIGGGENEKEWKVFSGSKLSESVCNALRKATSKDLKSGTRSARYRLDGVLSFVQDSEAEKEQGRGGHHVLHMRVPKAYKKHTYESQIEKTKNCVTDDSHLTLVSDVTSDEFSARIKRVEQELNDLKDEGPEDEWVLFNGPVVTKTIVEDAMAFHVKFKEPCIIIFRQIDADIMANKPLVDLSKVEEIDIPLSVFNSNSKGKLHPSESLPSRGDLIAFDAEFVSVQHEESILTACGSKMTVREGRNALARMSLLDCQTGEVIIDDHVLPREPVVDCLTRFSGIRFTDLDPRTSPHNLITTKNAYLKMRCLVDRGCIFVGHGLNQDFFTVNLHVPPCQIIDTLLIFHVDKRRFISLRFLVNYLLGRDMQQDVHDSVEDARAAYDLYLKAIELRKEGKFDKILEDIYEHGQRTDWKVGVDVKGKL